LEGCKPILKWPGGKRSLLPYLLKLVPSSYERYIEPFLGGGALFFSLLPKRALLSDKNEDLIACYQVIRNRPKALLSLLAGMQNSEEDYYRIRAMIPRTKVEVAARMIYLTTLSFNGIYRVNHKGQFNVPYGRKRHLKLPLPQAVHAVKEALIRCELSHCDFEQSLSRAGRGDFVYLDPPYTLAHDNNGFRKYNAQIFSWDDQARLAETVHRLHEKGCQIVVSNASHSSIRKMYKGFTQHVVVRSSTIAASSIYRRYVEESIFTNVN